MCNGKLISLPIRLSRLADILSSACPFDILVALYIATRVNKTYDYPYGYRLAIPITQLFVFINCVLQLLKPHFII